jgi:integrase
MVEKSFGLLFHLKAPKNTKGNDRHIYLKITVDGVTSEVALKRSWPADRWNQKSRRAIGTKEDARALNEYLESINAMVFRAKQKLIDSGKAITAAMIKQLITGQGNQPKKILRYFKEHNDSMLSLVGKDYAIGTWNRFDTAYRHTEEFILWKYEVEDLSLDLLNYEFITSYYHWLRTERACSVNSTLKYIQNFKKIVLNLIKKKIITSDPFVDFQVKKQVFKKQPLTNAELNRIRAKVFSTDRLSQIRDIFLFSCYTGLAYIDVKNLKISDIKVGEDGEKWIITTRQKTRAHTHIPLLPEPLIIMEKYTFHQKRVIEGYVLPVPTNQKVNAYLDEIADLCQISRNLTFHLARHTLRPL